MNLFNEIWNGIMINSLIYTLITLVTWIIILALINKGINTLLIKKKIVLNASQKRLKRTVFISILIVVIGFQFKFSKDILTALLASGGLIAIIIGLACQEAASNIIAGAMIFIARPYTIGDFIYLKEKDIRGTVVDITLRQTAIKTLNNTTLIIPNTTMNTAIIENISRIETSNVTYLYLSISYDDDIDKASDCIRELVLKHDEFMDPRKDDVSLSLQQAVPVLVTEFLDSGIQLRVSLFTSDSGTGFALACQLRKEIKTAFDDLGITIPYPTHTIYERKEG